MKKMSILALIFGLWIVLTLMIALYLAKYVTQYDKIILYLGSGTVILTIGFILGCEYGPKVFGDEK